MASNKSGLIACISPFNCVFVQKEFKDADKSFIQLKQIAENIPRTTVLETSKNYWKGVCRSLIFRFPDDLEILRIDSRNIIQVRSASRIGLSDLGVNQERVNNLYNQLKKKI